MNRKILKVPTKLILLPVVLIGLLLTATGLLYSSFALIEPIRSISFTSEKLNYEEKEPGSWKVEKSVQWIEKGKARITFDIDTISKKNEQYIDTILILDSAKYTSESDNKSFQILKDDTISIIQKMLEESNNRVALIKLDDESETLTGFTNDVNALETIIQSLEIDDGRNLYQAYVNVDTILKDYQNQDNRECQIILITNGLPKRRTPNEIVEYNYLKALYPYLNIIGIQYQLSNDILDFMKNVSDKQYVATNENLYEVLLEVSGTMKTYEKFILTDVIDHDNFELNSISKVKASIGNVTLENIEGKPTVTWTIDHFRTGVRPNLTIDIDLKKELEEQEGRYRTNERTKVYYQIDDIEETVSTTKSPILSTHYQVKYDKNEPTGCTIDTFPANETRAVFDIVKISEQSLVCEGYQFRGWVIDNADIEQINANYFVMPESDTVLKAEWGKVGIVKSMSGSITSGSLPIIKDAHSTLEQEYEGEFWKYKNSITKIVIKNTIEDIPNTIETFDISQEKNSSVLAYLVPNETNDSTYTVYIEGQGGVIANRDSSGLFYKFSKLSEIEGLEYFDTSNTVLMYGMFSNCTSLVNLNLSSFDTSKVTDMYSMFNECSNLVTLDVSNFDTSNTVAMYEMFSNCTSLVNLNLSSFDTSKVTDMYGMFYGCKSLTNLDISSFDTSKVKYLGGMFSGCSSLTSLDFQHFVTSSVVNMEWMFYNCQSLTSLNVSSFDTSKVTTMFAMFSDCTNLTSLDVSNFDTSNVKNMKQMFSNVNSISTLNLSSFYTPEVSDMSSMFYNCKSLVTLVMDHFDTSKVTDMNRMFMNCQKLESLDVSNFRTPNLQDMTYMFSYCSSLTNLDVSHFDTSNVTNMYGTFTEMQNAININISGFNTTKVRDMSYMFSGCLKLNNLDCSSFNTSSVSDMQQMFYDCKSLTNLDITNFRTPVLINMYGMFAGCEKVGSLDLGNFDTSNVTNMYGTFANMYSLTSINVNSFNTSKVTNMGLMFYECNSLPNLNVSSFDTTSVTDMQQMFYGCTSLTSLDITNFKTPVLIDMYGMFYNCQKITSLDLRGFDTSNVTNMYGTFAKMYNVTSIDVSSFDTSKVTNMGSMFFDCQNLSNLDTSNFDTSSATDVTCMFYYCLKVNTSINFTFQVTTNYEGIFYGTSYSSGKVIVNYSSGLSGVIDNIIATKQESQCNVVKGSQL